MSKPPNKSELIARALLTTAVIAVTAYAAVLGLSAEVPERLPGVALGSPDLYKEELGVAHLVGFYFVILLIALAVYGRGLVKFGKDGAEAGDVIDKKVEAQSDAAEKISEALHELERVGKGNAKGIEAVRQALKEKARDDERRFKALEEDLRELRGREGRQ